MRKINVVLVARPDQSLQIYNALLQQNALSFKYITFKVFPQWIKKLTKYRKMTTVSRDAICSWRLTIINICKFKFRFGFAQSWNETSFLGPILKKVLKRSEVSLIHYWPEYGNKEVLQYVKMHPSVKSFADVHMPHPKAIFESMKPVYSQYGIKPETTQLYAIAREQSDVLGDEINVLVPSLYVAETYKQIYPNKKYFIVSYGITVNIHYSKQYKEKISNFVYAGRISLEKGSDLLLEYFSNHNEYTLHLFGGVLAGQESIFCKYQNYENIIFHGSVPKVELQNYLKKYDVGIHLSRFDAYSLAVGEMIGIGLPVIVSDHTGNMDDVLNEGFGEITDLTYCGINKAIKNIVDVNIYNKYIDNIDSYIHHKHQAYGTKMVSFYNSMING
ncbi:MAG: glycosyltransferase [Fibrobacter sp.]|nr:glycosyltransferase [Fibrobacter sp.]